MKTSVLDIYLLTVLSVSEMLSVNEKEPTSYIKAEAWVVDIKSQVIYSMILQNVPGA